MFQQLLQEDFRMLQVVSTGAYYPPVDTTWKILTTGASQLTAGALCTAATRILVEENYHWSNTSYRVSQKKLPF